MCRRVALFVCLVVWGLSAWAWFAQRDGPKVLYMDAWQDPFRLARAEDFFPKDFRAEVDEPADVDWFVMSAQGKLSITRLKRARRTNAVISEPHLDRLNYVRVFGGRWDVPLKPVAIASGALAAILFLSPRVRSWWRVRHNRCVRCGYCLAGLSDPRCPECGTHFSARH